MSEDAPRPLRPTSILFWKISETCLQFFPERWRVDESEKKADKSLVICFVLARAGTKYEFIFRKEKIMKTFNQISEQLERVYRLYYNFGCGSTKMLEKAEKFFNSQQNIGLCF